MNFHAREEFFGFVNLGLKIVSNSYLEILTVE